MTVDEILKLATEEDGFAVVERLAAMPDAVAAMTLYADAVNEAYWKRKDLNATVMLARAGIQHGMTSALAVPAGESDRATQMRGKAKALAYNLASFTWPGWDEPGLVCDAGLVAAGYDAAKLNIRLARQLNKGDLPMSRGLWMLAGHELCRKHYVIARGYYELAARHAHAAGSAAEEALGNAFAALSDLIEKPDDPARREKLDSLKKKLGEVEEGPAFVQQVDAARKVFVK